MRDLYRILGVRSRAAEQEIYKAYRQQAKRLHPDAGGSAESFSELVHAYEVLSDPRRRERYDRTGEDEPLPKNLDANAMKVIAMKLGALVYAESDVTLKGPAVLIQEAIEEDIRQRKGNISSHMRAIVRLAKLRSRVTSRDSDAESRLARVFDWHEQNAKHSLKRERAAVQIMERALEILQDYGVLEDKSPSFAEDLSAAVYDVLECFKRAGQFQPSP